LRTLSSQASRRGGPWDDTVEIAKDRLLFVPFHAEGHSSLRHELAANFSARISRRMNVDVRVASLIALTCSGVSVDKSIVPDITPEGAGVKFRPLITPTACVGSAGP
jgi:hypothetical protein